MYVSKFPFLEFVITAFDREPSLTRSKQRIIRKIHLKYFLTLTFSCTNYWIEIIKANTCSNFTFNFNAKTRTNKV